MKTPSSSRMSLAFHSERGFAPLPKPPPRIRRAGNAGVERSLGRAASGPGVADLGLGRRQPGDGDHVRRAGDVGHANSVAEVDRGRLATVLAADADLQIGPRPAPALDPDPDQLADSLLIQDR